MFEFVFLSCQYARVLMVCEEEIVIAAGGSMNYSTAASERMSEEPLQFFSAFLRVSAICRWIEVLYYSVVCSIRVAILVCRYVGPPDSTGVYVHFLCATYYSVYTATHSTFCLQLDSMQTGLPVD